MPHSATARDLLDRDFLHIRAQIIELAAFLDRLDRADGDPAQDPRWGPLQQAVRILVQRQGDRAEQVLLNFSRPYEPNWADSFGLRPPRPQ